MRLIDANELKMAWDGIDGKMHTPVAIIRALIDDAPTIDAVPVVRCKECKHKGGFGCPWWKGEDIPTDWYCANGERMTDATD